jgi:UDP-N-acetylmuramoyl-tripeptide--D-alanyl-D-alanine ligase
MRIIPGLKGSLIIDDTYNSSPHATRAALETLIDIPKVKRRVAVLGDMLELGKFSVEAHKEIGKKAAECCDQLITVGFRSRGIAEAAIDAGLSEKKVRQYEHGESRRAGKELESELGPGVVVLVKGSQSMRMEHAVKEIMLDPERAPELLVRQEEEWLER